MTDEQCRTVVADAGPLNYLILIGCTEILPALFDRVLVPTAVKQELNHPGAPPKVKEWIRNPPHWIQIASGSVHLAVRGLHAGETATLQVALERNTSAILMDDMDGRAAAQRVGLVPIFTLAILERAAEKGIINLVDAVMKLRQTSFFVSNEVLDAALERERQRTQKKKID